MKRLQFPVLCALALALAACTPTHEAVRPTIPPPSAGILSGVPSSTLPPALTEGAAVTLPPHSPNFLTPGEQLANRILTSDRHASLAQAGKALPFAPRLPRGVDDAQLLYLLTEPGGPNSHPATFWAVYYGGALQIAEWQDRDQPLPTAGVPATQTVHGLPATINLHGDQVFRSNVLWKEGDMFFNLWYTGSLEDALRIAESIPGS